MVTQRATVEQLIQKGEEAYLRRDYDIAIELLNKSLEEDPENLETHYILGISYSKKEKYTAALKHFSTIVNSNFLFVNTNHVRVMMGYIYVIMSKYQQAIEHLEKAISFDETNTTALSLIANCFYKLSEYRKAIEHYKKVLKYDSKNVNALNSLGYILIEQDIDIRQGLDICLEAIQLKPESAAILDSIGWAYYKLGDEEQAGEYLKKAFEYAPDNQEIKEHVKFVFGL